MNIPEHRGSLSAKVAGCLRTGEDLAEMPTVPATVLVDEDAQLALWMLFELHYRGFDDAQGDREWDPELIRLRGELEARMEEELREATRDMLADLPGDDVVEDLCALIDADDSPSLAAYLHRHATQDQVLEFLRERSIYALKEADAHSFVLGRLDGPVKAALAEVQYDEYGSGRPERLHSTMYADALEACGLDSTYGAYLGQVSAETLAVNNLHSLFALRRRLRGAAMGHFATFEATSSLPCRKIAGGIQRVGLPEQTAAYFDEHIEADAVHEQVALRDVCGGLVRQHPELRDDVMFGSAACLYLDGVAATRVLERWGALTAPAQERRAS